MAIIAKTQGCAAALVVAMSTVLASGCKSGPSAVHHHQHGSAVPVAMNAHDKGWYKRTTTEEWTRDKGYNSSPAQGEACPPGGGVVIPVQPEPRPTYLPDAPPKSGPALLPVPTPVPVPTIPKQGN